MIMFENCQNNFLVYGGSTIQGTTFYSCRNLMKPGSQSGTYKISCFKYMSDHIDVISLVSSSINNNKNT